MGQTIALISDVHANVWALDAVLNDIQRRGIQRICDLGDSLLGPLDPVATAEMFIRADLPSIRGNNDRTLIQRDASISSTVEFVRKQVTPRHLSWLQMLPLTRVLDDEILLCHGTPFSDLDYLLEDPTPHGGRLRASQAVLHSLGDTRQAVIACGHSHTPRAVLLASGQLVVNPGSVGLPAYTDDQPVVHGMECGSPHARYAILSNEESGWGLEQVLVPYEWKKAVQAARDCGREDWARWLATGRV